MLAREQVNPIMKIDAMLTAARNVLSIIDGQHGVVPGKYRTIQIGIGQEPLLLFSTCKEIGATLVNGTETTVARRPALAFGQRDRAVAVKSELRAAGRGLGRRQLRSWRRVRILARSRRRLIQVLTFWADLPIVL